MAYSNRGVAYYWLNKNKEAIANYNKAIELNLNFAMAYSNRGLAYDWKEDFEKAIDDFDKAIKLNPDDAVAYYNRGVAYYTLESYRKAKRDYNKAIALDPNFGIAHANLGDLLYTIAEDYDNAEKEYREGLKIKKDIAYAHNGLGLVLTKRKAYKEAIAEFEKALKLNNAEIFYNNLGCAYAEYGKECAIPLLVRLDKAQNNLRKATSEKGKREKWKHIILYSPQEKNTYVEAHKNLSRVVRLIKKEF